MTESELLNALEGATVDSQSELIVNALNALTEKPPIAETPIETPIETPEILDATTQQTTTNAPVKQPLKGELLPSEPLPELQTLSQVLDGIMSLEGKYIDHAYKLCITISIGNLTDNFKLLNGLKSKTKGTLAGIARAYVVMPEEHRALALENLRACSNIEHVTKLWGGSGILPKKDEILTALPDTPTSIRDVEEKAYMVIGKNGKAIKKVEKISLEQSNEVIINLISDSVESTPDQLKITKAQLDQMILSADYNVETIFQSACNAIRSNKFKSLLLKMNNANIKIKAYEKDEKEKTTAMKANYNKFTDLQKFIATQLNEKGFNSEKILSESKRLSTLDKLDYKDEIVCISAFKSTSRTISQVAKQPRKTKKTVKKTVKK